MIKENTPLLETERLILRKFVEKDIEDILLIYSDKEVNKFLPWFPIATIEEATEYLHSKILPRYTLETDYCYAIELKSNSRVIGYVQISDIGESNDMGYGLRKEFWRKGITTEACRAVCERFKLAGHSYITATHDVNNPNSGEVMKKLKMTYCYSYKEQWQPKDVAVVFRMYQLNFVDNLPIYSKYQKQYPHFVEDIG